MSQFGQLFRVRAKTIGPDGRMAREVSPLYTAAEQVIALLHTEYRMGKNLSLYTVDTLAPGGVKSSPGASFLSHNQQA